MEFKWTGAKFDGKSDIAEWLRKFRATLDAFGVEEPDRYRALVLALHEDVLTRVMSELAQLEKLIPLKERTGSWLEKELTKRYTTVKTVRELLLEFLSRRMMAHESAEAYLHAKKQLFYEFAAAMKNDKFVWSENGSYFLEEAIEGLPKELQFHVKTSNPVEGRTFDNVCKDAKNVHGAQPPRISTSTEEKPGIPSPAVPDPTSRPTPVCDHCGKQGHAKWQCRRLKQEQARSGGQQGSERKTDDVSSVTTSTGHRPFIPLEVFSENKPLKLAAVVDTGASTTFIATRAAEKISDRQHWQSYNGLPPIAANSTTLKTSGRIQLRLRLPTGQSTEVNAIVAENLLHDFILGTDALVKLQAKIDFSARRLETTSGPVLFLDSASAQQMITAVGLPRCEVKSQAQQPQAQQALKRLPEAQRKSAYPLEVTAMTQSVGQFGNAQPRTCKIATSVMNNERKPGDKSKGVGTPWPTCYYDPDEDSSGEESSF